MVVSYLDVVSRHSCKLGLLCLTSLSADKAQLKAMLNAVCDLMRGGQLSAPHCVQTPFHQYTHALQATVQSHSRKHVLIM